MNYSQTLIYKKEDRDSNIEMLRIIAMLMIVSHHLIVHGVMNFTDGTKSFIAWGQGSIINRVASCLMFPGGEIGVGIFFITTGYFYITRNKANVLHIIVETLFYGVVLSILSILLFILKLGEGGYIISSLKSVVLPVSGGTYWFVTVYVFILLLVPLVNPLFRNIYISAQILLLIFLYLFWFVLASLGSPFFSLQKGLLFFMIGAFVRLHDFTCSKRTATTVISLFVLLWLLESCFAYGIAFWGADQSSSSAKILYLIFKTCETAVSPFCSLLLFLFFLKRNRFVSKMINTIAATTFGVYLIHDSMLLRNLLWHKVLFVDTKLYFSFFFPLYMLFIPLIVFMVCATIDYLRLVYFTPIMNKYLDALTNAINNRLYQS